MKGVTVSDDIQVGDKVRVVFEDTVDEIRDGIIYFGLDNRDDWIVGYEVGDGHTESIKVVEKKKVTHFRPGDLVKHRLYGTRYLVTGEGVAHLDSGKHFTRPSETWKVKYLNSDHYELITLHESPL